MSKESDIFNNNSKVLVTGGAGFIGSNIVEKFLGIGCKVRVLDNFSTGKEENIIEFSNHQGFELIRGDIRDIEVCRKACQDIDYVLHQAALGSVPRSINDPKTTNDVNISGTLNMLVAARDSKVEKFIYASSSSVYGDDQSLLKVEPNVGKPLSPYATTKVTCEYYAKIFYDIFGLPTIGLRYFNVFGKKQDPESRYAAVIPIFIKSLLLGEAPIIYGDGMQSRDFTYIENVVEANIRACFADISSYGEEFNIACNDPITINQVYEKIRYLLDVDIEPIYMPERPADVKYSNADITKSKNILGYYPSIKFQEGLKCAIDWYKSSFRSE